MADREFRFAPIAGADVRDQTGAVVGTVVRAHSNQPQRKLEVTFRARVAPGVFREITAVYTDEDLVRRVPSEYEWKVAVSAAGESVSS